MTRCRSKAELVDMDMSLSSRMLSRWQSDGHGLETRGDDDSSKLNKIVVTPRGKSSLMGKLLRVGFSATCNLRADVNAQRILFPKLVDA